MTPTTPSTIAEIFHRHALAEKARGKDGGPDRHGEFDRHHLTERNQGERVEPADLRPVVNKVASDMLQRPRRLHGSETAIDVDQRVEHEEGDARAQLHDLEHVQFARGLASRHHQDQHQSKPARHPYCGPWFGRCSVHRREWPGHAAPARRKVGKGGRYRRPLPDLQRANMPMQ
jgi:hypothetical protein